MRLLLLDDLVEINAPDVLEVGVVGNAPVLYAPPAAIKAVGHRAAGRLADAAIEGIIQILALAPALTRRFRASQV